MKKDTKRNKVSNIVETILRECGIQVGDSLLNRIVDRKMECVKYTPNIYRLLFIKILKNWS